MKYISTRSKKNAGPEVESAEAILKGLADDGGLFVPESIPQLTLEQIKSYGDMKYEDRAADIIGRFLTDYTVDELKECAQLAYDWFDSTSRAPLSVLRDKDEKDLNQMGVLELWHGPTSAFKDMALQMLPHFMRLALKKTGEKHNILILVATSGDTGKAALAGFADVPQTKVMVFYPDGGVSKIQRLQMVTQVGKNVNVTAVRGNFDDCQNGVKQIFGDEEFSKRLETVNVKLSSANSINWGRLVPQIVYYISAYTDLVNTEQIKLGDEVNITVPTGNFGNILAAYYAKRMGLPVNKLICASNVNHVLTDFFRRGVYNRNRDFYKTITPSMDILISSNLERLLYHETNDSARVKKYMDALRQNGKYKIEHDLKKKLDRIFYADFATEDETRAIIKRVFDNFDYVIDTHTAVAMSVAAKYNRKTGDNRAMILASTASPYKFAPAVLTALGVENVDQIEEFEQLHRLNVITGVRIPQNLASLKSAQVLHTDVCDGAQMSDMVFAFAQK